MNTQETNTSQEFEYKAEMKQLLHIIVHSLYTHPEIFIRELVSNASDALNKIRFKRLTDSNILNPELELKIDINIDEKEQTFEISDTGIGMTMKDLTDRIGTIASSGTLEFFTKMKEENKTLDANLIGKFGVGFYSVFMVTDDINIETRSAEPNSKSFHWKSIGETKFLIEEIPDRQRGTKIYFKIKDEHKEYCTPYVLKNILKKYSNFVDFPIYINGEKVNQVSALWQKPKDQITKEELDEFYKFISNDHQPPLGHLHLAMEGNINFKALIFIPETAPQTLFQDVLEKSVQLYANRIFIQDNCKELLPDYLKFVKGVVDTEDLPLNVSREIVQASPITAKIRNIITTKILNLLEEWSEKEKDKYEKFYINFGSLFKTGINSDFTNKEKIIELLRFETSEKPQGEVISLNEYVKRMPEEQKEIYYLLGDHRDNLEKNPNLELFKKKGIEVLFLTDPVDIFTIPYIFEYDKKSLKSIEKADLNLDDVKVNEDSLSKELGNSIIEMFKKILGDKIEDVIVSKRLVDSPVTLVVGKEGYDPQMEKIMQVMDKSFTVAKRILEINMAHPLIKNLSKIYIANNDNNILQKAVTQLYEGALLLEGKMTSPADFIKRMTEFMEEATR